MAAPANNAFTGTLKFIYNTTSQPMTIKHQDATSSPLNFPEERIVTLTGADVVVPGPAVARIIYDDRLYGDGTKRWVYVGAG